MLREIISLFFLFFFFLKYRSVKVPAHFKRALSRIYFSKRRSLNGKCILIYSKVTNQLNMKVAEYNNKLKIGFTDVFPVMKFRINLHNLYEGIFLNARMRILQLEKRRYGFW